MDIRWTTALLDIPLRTYRDAMDFWCAVTDSRMSSRRGQAGEYQTLLPHDGADAFVRSQMFDDGPRVHLDLHVGHGGGAGDAGFVAARSGALAAGARVLHEGESHVVLASPGGFVFCLVGYHGESVRPGPVDGVILDQLCLDLPATLFDAELAFWERLTGWPAPAHAPAAAPTHAPATAPAAPAPAPVSEATPTHAPAVPGTDEASLTARGDLVRPDGMPLRLLLQRLGDDPRTQVTAHLDLAVGDKRTETIAAHLALGASVVGHGARWTTLRDPAGLPYCLTDRDPATGLLAVT